jgi:hypothetical protein
LPGGLNEKVPRFHARRVAGGDRHHRPAHWYFILPALQKARDQANTVACQSNERQFYALMMEYASDYQQYVVPARLNTNILTSSQMFWWSALLIGNELGMGQNTLTSNTARQLAQSQINKFLTCPSADHSLDPSLGTAGNNYYGDYTYNQNLGCADLEPLTK